jgi:hypothetical protein
MGGEELFSQSEVKGLTGKSARGAQAEWLAGQGVPFRRDGARILVSREHVRRWLSGEVLRQSAGVRMELVK